MLLQYFIRGISKLDTQQAQRLLSDSGILCAALRNGHASGPDEVERQLSDQNLDRHLHDFDAYRDMSPYISTSAGTWTASTERTPTGRAMFALDTALNFAVVIPRADGWLFYGYTFVLGRPAQNHAEFSDEVRDTLQFPRWSKYRSQGEVVVAIRIPPRRLARAERYQFDDVMKARENGEQPTPVEVLENEAVYRSPDTILSARGTV